MRRRWRPQVVLLATLVLAAGWPTAAAKAEGSDTRRCFGRRVTITGTAGADRIEGTPGADVILGLGGDDRVEGGDGRDRICGGSGDDALEGRYGADLMAGDAGDDRLDGGPRDDLLVGGGGGDRLAGGDGRSDADTIVGGAGPDVLRGGGGELSVDYLFGGAGKDFLDGGIGGADRLYPGAGADYASGGEVGRDVVSFEFAPSPISLDLASDPFPGGNATGEGADTVVDVEGVVGSDHADAVNGTDGGETLRGMEGDDVITTGEGNDDVDGGDGSDTLDGGAGLDVVRFEDSSSGVTASLVTRRAAGGGDDSLIGFESLTGSFFDDELTGDNGPNALDGSFGLNQLFALGGDDYLEFGGGDAGSGEDECIWSGAENCERSGHFDPPTLPFISEPRRAHDVDELARISGGIAGGIVGPRDATVVLVSLRRMTAQGCWWWNGRHTRGGFDRAGCETPIANEAKVRDGRWSISVDVPLTPGRYEARVNWRNFGFGCGGTFGPMCVEFDVP